MIFIVSVSTYLTVRSGFFQIRGFAFILRKTMGRVLRQATDRSDERLTPFQATVLSVGGPGAIFWIWVLAILGMMIYRVPEVLFAGVENVDRLWVFANLAVGSCALPNLVALALSGAFFVLLRDYLSGKLRRTPAETRAA